ncbi:MAG TPA: type II secretion system protein M [Steroidobacteraceae bacterium]|nr:type II secretion system protein M [Steroidobacteraceae bacterium]
MKLSPDNLTLDAFVRWFTALSERERRMVLAGAVLAPLLLIFGVLLPLDRSVAHAHDRLLKKRNDLAWMQGVAPELAAAPQPPSAAGESLLVIVDRSARESGLAGSLAGSEPAGPGGLSLRLQKAPFDALIAWLARLAQQNGIRVDSASIDSAGAPGLVNAAVVLRTG